MMKDSKDNTETKDSSNKKIESSVEEKKPPVCMIKASSFVVQKYI